MSFVASRLIGRRAAALFGAAAAAAATAASFTENNSFKGYNNNNNNNKNGSSWGKGLFGFSFAAAPALHVAAFDSQTKQEEYQKVYNAIAEKIRDEDDYDNGIGYGPVLVRIAWHSSGTYDKHDNSGGSYGGTYRFEKESNDPSNNGLQNAANFLKPIHEKFPWLSHGDLYTLAGVTAVQEAQGPKIPWRPGRVDQPEESTPDNGKLPDANQNADYVRHFFDRFGFNDREVVALMGAHALGKTHLKNSGYEGPWGAASNVFSNEFFVNLLTEEWKYEKNEAGNMQYNSPKGYMMLPSDMALVKDSKYLPIVKEYAADQDAFFKDFAAAFVKLLENGISYPKESKPFIFKTLDEQED